MKTLILVRREAGPTEVTSPVGPVAEAVVLADGRAILHWLTTPYSTEIYPSETALRAVRESGGWRQSGAWAAEVDITRHLLPPGKGRAGPDKRRYLAEPGRHGPPEGVAAKGCSSIMQ